MTNQLITYRLRIDYSLISDLGFVILRLLSMRIYEIILFFLLVHLFYSSVFSLLSVILDIY